MDSFEEDFEVPKAPKPEPIKNIEVRKEDKSQITLKEVKDSVKFLENNDSHKNFLEAIGLTPEEIEKYSKIDTTESE